MEWEIGAKELRWAQKEERVSYRTPRGQRAEGRSGSIVRKMTELMDHESYVEKLRN